jgi:Flp pilus assembly protein TadD
MMKRRGLVLTLAGTGWLLAGCASGPGTNADNGLTAAARLRVAAAAETSGDQQTAASMYLAAANEAPADGAVQLRSAEGLARNNRLDGAESVLQRRLKTNPKEHDLLRTLGAVQVLAGKPLQAVQTLSRLLTDKPDDMPALVDEAVALDILHRHAEAQALYARALAHSPEDAAISNDIAVSLLLSGRAAEAQRVLAPFAGAAGLPERIRTNLGIIDAAAARPADAQGLLGSKIDAAGLATLMQAIGRPTMAREGQP